VLRTPQARNNNHNSRPHRQWHAGRHAPSLLARKKQSEEEHLTISEPSRCSKHGFSSEINVDISLECDLPFPNTTTCTQSLAYEARRTLKKSRSLATKQPTAGETKLLQTRAFQRPITLNRRSHLASTNITRIILHRDEKEKNEGPTHSHPGDL
jgi:hypothetical protein